MKTFIVELYSFINSHIAILIHSGLRQCHFGKNVRVAIKTDLSKSSFEDYSNIVHDVQVSNSTVGKRTSIGRYTKIRDTDIGSYCSISWDTTIGAVAHPIDRLSSHAFAYRKQFGIVDNDIKIKQKRTIIGNDVWIGCNCVILAGVKLVTVQLLEQEQ